MGEEAQRSSSRHGNQPRSTARFGYFFLRFLVHPLSLFSLGSVKTWIPPSLSFATSLSPSLSSLGPGCAEEHEKFRRGSVHCSDLVRLTCSSAHNRCRLCSSPLFPFPLIPIIRANSPSGTVRPEKNETKRWQYGTDWGTR